MQVIKAPFKLTYILKKLGVPYSKYRSDNETTLNALFINPKEKAKYLIVLLELGSLLQEELSSLDLTRICDVKRFKSAINWSSHILVSLHFAGKPLTYPKENKPFTAEEFLLWHRVLDDTLKQLEAYVTSFVGEMQTSNNLAASEAALETAILVPKS